MGALGLAGPQTGQTYGSALVVVLAYLDERAGCSYTYA
jgi:hypothetical protein